MGLLAQGILLGIVLVLPGMSGGTVFVIFGIYEQLIRDLSRFHLKPYIPMFVGISGGIFISGSLFTVFFDLYRDETVVFLMGCLLASIRSVLRGSHQVTKQRTFLCAAGIVLGYILGGEPVGVLSSGVDVGYGTLVLGGALSSATMVLPGLPGSSILIVMGIYDRVLFYLSQLVWERLVVFGLGGIFGIFVLIRLLERFYEKYRGPVSFFFAGLILGSVRALLPESYHIIQPLLLITGFSAVWFWSGKA